MKPKNEIDRDKKLDDTVEQLTTITREINNNIENIGKDSEKLVSLIKELNKNTKTHNKILIGLSFMLLALTLIEVSSNLTGLSILIDGILSNILWLIGGILVILEGLNLFFEWVHYKLTKFFKYIHYKLTKTL